MVAWSQLVISPNEEALSSLASSWEWCIGGDYEPIMFSAFGDMFYTTSAGTVFWLNTGAGESTQVADSPEIFGKLLGTELASDWFLPPLVEQLHRAGKILPAGYCYFPTILPIFAEGKYTVENLNPVPATEHFAATGELHQQLRKVPDGARVRLSLVESPNNSFKPKPLRGSA